MKKQPLGDDPFEGTTETILPTRDFPHDPVVKHLLCNAGDMGSIPGQGSKITHALEQLAHVPHLLNLRATTRDRAPH